MLKIWGRRNSLNVQAVMWMVGELGIGHERYDAGLQFGVNHTPEFLAMNPNGLVPVITDDGDPIFESAAICRYLAARYADDAFWPADPARRAQIDKWAEWGKTTVYPVFGGIIFRQMVRTPAAKRDLSAVTAAIRNFGNILDIAEEQLKHHDFLAGSAFTLADISFGHQLFRYFTVGIERPSHPLVEAYYERLCQRPAYREHVMVSYADLQL